MGKTRQTGSLISEGNIYLDLTNRTIGIGSTSGFSGNVRGNLTGEVDSTAFDTNLSGIVVTGVTTSTQFSTGSGAIGINTNTIYGPATLTIDPASVGDNTGTVVIKGDLQVDGTHTVINSTVVNIDDKNITLGSGSINDAAADGGGITIESGEGNKTFQFENSGDNFGSSENMNLASGKVYKINNTSVLSSNTLGSGVVNSSLTSVGTLGKLDVGNVNSTGIVTASGGFSGNLTGEVNSASFDTNSSGIVVTGVATATGGFSGNFTGTVIGNSDSATKLQTARTIALTGDVVGEASFDGSSNVSIAATIQPNSVALGGDTTGNYVATIADSGSSDIVVNNSGTETAAVTLGLSATGVSSGSYGSSSAIPTFTVDSKGRLTSVGTSSIVTSLTVNGDSGTEVIDLSTESLSISGGTNLTSSAAGNAVTLNLDPNISLSNISASGIITATNGFVGDITGTATSTTNIPNLTGDITSSNTTTTLATVNSNVGTFGSSTEIPSITVNAKGLVTGVTTSAITVGNGTLTLNVSGTGLSGSQTFTANQSGNSTFTVTSDATSNNTNGTIVSRDGSGGFSAGTIVASSFVGPLTGVASTATKLLTPRTFEITGDIIASPVNFDGTGNVSLAATIQPNSVALGSDTTGDYVQTITGTSNQITVTSGTGEGSTPTLSVPNQFTAPQDVTVTRDLQVNRNLNINGNITIGGTSATLFATEFKVYDPDIVLGFRTDGSGIDLSNDNTANHGGVAIASTEGTPLISLYDVALGETNPATYKKFMWFKSGSFSGLGTDAWISNYAIGIGSTQVPNGVRLAAGGMQVTDTRITTPNLNITGVTTSGITRISSSTASPNDTTPVATIAAVGASSNYDIAIVPKGTGAIVANIPDGTATGGNKRGTYSVDLQLSRSSATQVVSGTYSVIGGGNNNTVGGNSSFVGGGQSNSTGVFPYSAIVGGQNNLNNGGSHSFIGGGYNNQSQTDYAAIVGGTSNAASGQYSSILGGSNNKTESAYSSVLGGYYNNAKKNYSSVIGGYGANTRNTYGAVAFAGANTSFGTGLGGGYQQSRFVILSKFTLDDTPSTLTANGSSSYDGDNVLDIPAATAYLVKGSVIAYAVYLGSGTTRAWEFTTVIKRQYTNPSIVGTPIINDIAYDSGASGWNLSITADASTTSLKVEVTGQALTSIRWVTKIDSTEVSF